MHDRAKGGVARDEPFLQALSVVKSDGSPRAGMSAKLRQIDKFVETLAALVKRGVGEAAGVAGAPRPPLRIVDAGCGRGYLTFAAHAHFHTQGWAVQSTGVEMRWAERDASNACTPLPASPRLISPSSPPPLFHSIYHFMALSMADRISSSR